MVDDDNRKAGSDAHGRAKAFVTECNLIENCINLMQKEGCQYFVMSHYIFACELLKNRIHLIRIHKRLIFPVDNFGILNNQKSF